MVGLSKLDLSELGMGRLPAITPAVGSTLAEAAGVCLESQGHYQGDLLQVRGDYDNRYSLAWPPVTEQARRCWNDPEYATEHGAYGIAVLLAKKEIGYTVIERSRKGTGFDYWCGDDTDLPFQNKARLEVSGIRCGNQRDVSGRVKEKLEQTKQSDGLLPAYIIVIEFGTPVAEVRRK